MIQRLTSGMHDNNNFCATRNNQCLHDAILSHNPLWDGEDAQVATPAVSSTSLRGSIELLAAATTDDLEARICAVRKQFHRFKYQPH